MRAMEAGLTTVMLPTVLLWRRLHGSNLGSRRRDARSDYVRILKASLDRRRATRAIGREASSDPAPDAD
jgi:hypothetical protein